MSDFFKKLIGGIVLAALLIAIGRFTAPEKVRVETKTITVEVEKEKQATDTKTKTVENDNKDGSKTITTVTDTSTHTTTNTDIDTKSDSVKETTYAKDGVTISALAGIDVTNPSKGFVYGASLSKPILGPISIIVEGQSNKVISVGLGLKF